MPVPDWPPHSLLGPPLTFSPCWAFVLSSFFITCLFVFLLHYFVSFRLFLSNRAHASFFCPLRLSLLVGYVPTATFIFSSISIIFLFLLSFSFRFPFLIVLFVLSSPVPTMFRFRAHLARTISSQSPGVVMLAEHPSPTGLLIPSLVLLSLSLLGLCSLFLFYIVFLFLLHFLFHFVS